MIKDFWDKSAEFIVLAAYAVGLLNALAIFGWQVFHWLRISTWVPLPFYEAFAYLGIDVTSIYMPTDWQGLAKVAQCMLDVPLSIAIPVMLVSVAYIWQAFISDTNKHA